MRFTVNGERLAGPGRPKIVAMFFVFALLLCAGASDSGPSKAKIQELASYDAAKAKWDQQAAELQARGKPLPGHHDPGPYREFLKQWPESEFADQVFLSLLEEGMCADWKGFPDCGVIAIQADEEFLRRYPSSKLREPVELKMAQAYYEMARLWLYGQGEHNEKWSDLFRGQGLKMALALGRSTDPAIREQAAELARKCNADFPRPIAPAPAGVLDSNYL